MERKERLCDACGRLVNYNENFGHRIVMGPSLVPQRLHEHDFCPTCYRKFFGPLLDAFLTQRSLYTIHSPR